MEVINEYSQGPNIDFKGIVRVLLAKQFRSHVIGCATVHFRLASPGGKAEVNELDFFLLPNNYIVRLDVPVTDVLGVKVGNGRDQCSSDVLSF